MNSRIKHWPHGVLLLLSAVVAMGATPATQPLRTIEARQKDPPYKPQPTRLLADLPPFSARAMPERTPFGGVTRYPKSKATGFFRTERIDGRWWVIDPQGCRMVDVGVASTSVKQQSDEVKAAFAKKFGSPDAWAAQTRQLLRDSGFDGTGCWSDDDRLNANTDRPLVHTRLYSFMGKYGSERGGTFAEAGHRGYPEKCIFVFDPDFAASADRVAQGMTAHKDEPYLLGYFTDNELPFPLDSLDRYLRLPEKDPGRVAVEAFVHARGDKSKPLTAEDRQAWIGVVADKYFSVVHAAIRKYDPNHLILGPRFHATDYRDQALMRAAGPYIDVVGYNMYGVWTPGTDMLQRITTWTGRPILITEFYAKAEDSGLTNKDGAGWLVKTQLDRAAFYENFTLGLLESKVVVGWHWFRYIDNDPAFADGTSASDSNKGILNRTYEPYLPLLTAMRRVNFSRYDVIDYFDHSPRQ